MIVEIQMKAKKREDVSYFEIQKKKKCVEHWHKQIGAFFLFVLLLYI